MISDVLQKRDIPAVFEKGEINDYTENWHKLTRHRYNYWYPTRKLLFR